MAKVSATSKSGGDFVPVEPGTHLASLRSVVDLGRQETNFKGETGKDTRFIWISNDVPALTGPV